MKNISMDFIENGLASFYAEIMPWVIRIGEFILFSFFVLCLLTFVSYLRNFILSRVLMRRPKPLKFELAEIIKNLFKISLVPSDSVKLVFFLAPVFSFVLCAFFLFFLPIFPDRVTPHIELGLLYMLFISSLGAYAFILGGWSSGSNFSFLGAVRAFAQTISSQLILVMSALIIMMSSETANLSLIVDAQRKVWFIFPHFPVFILYIISFSMIMISSPFEAPKSKKEIASGIYSEYSGGLYLFYVCSDYLLLLLGSILGSLLFLGGGLPFFALPAGSPVFWLAVKSIMMLFVFVLTQSVLPNYKTSQIMQLSYKVFLPFLFAWVLLTAGIILIAEGGVV